MKKFISLLLALVMVLSLSTVAFATGEDGETTTPTDATSVTIKKTYKLVGEGSNPAETFTLQQVGNGVVTDGEATSAPALGAITGASFTAGEATADGVTKDITVALPRYDHVGVYTYTLKEAASTTAGVTYFGGDIKLVVTVVNGENGNLRIAGVHTEAGNAGTPGNGKSDTFENTYSAGTLKVSKTVTGNLGDKTKYFEFKVTLTGVEGKTYAETFAVTGGSYENNPETATLGENTFYLKHGETISIANLPYNVTYAVTETAADGYTTTKTGETGSINATEQTAAFINNKVGTVDTGVMLDSLPYILVLAFVAVAGTALILKKRANV